MGQLCLYPLSYINGHAANAVCIVHLLRDGNVWSLANEQRIYMGKGRVCVAEVVATYFSLNTT